MELIAPSVAEMPGFWRFPSERFLEGRIPWVCVRYREEGYVSHICSVPDTEVVSHQTSGFEWMQVRPVSWVGMPDEKAGHDLEVMLESGNSVPLGSKRRLGKGRGILTPPHPHPRPPSY